MYRQEYSMKIIGRNLKRLRKQRGYSVNQIKEYLRLGSVQAVYKYEEGKSFPQADTLLALMELYQVGVKEIVYDTNLTSGRMDYSAIIYEYGCSDIMLEAFDDKRHIRFISKYARIA